MSLAAGDWSNAPTPSVVGQTVTDQTLIGRAPIPTLIGQAQTVSSMDSGGGGNENQRVPGGGSAPCVQASAPPADTINTVL